MTTAWPDDLRALAAPVPGAPLWPVIPEELVLSCASYIFGVERRELLGARRQAILVRARSFCVWSMRSLGPARSYPEIGCALGGRDHSTIVHLHQKALVLRQRDRDFDADCRWMEHRYREFNTKAEEKRHGHTSH